MRNARKDAAAMMTAAIADHGMSPVQNWSKSKSKTHVETLQRGHAPEALNVRNFVVCTLTGNSWTFCENSVSTLANVSSPGVNQSCAPTSEPPGRPPPQLPVAQSPKPSPSASGFEDLFGQSGPVQVELEPVVCPLAFFVVVVVTVVVVVVQFFMPLQVVLVAVSVLVVVVVPSGFVFVVASVLISMPFFSGALGTHVLTPLTSPHDWPVFSSLFLDSQTCLSPTVVYTQGFSSLTVSGSTESLTSSATSVPVPVVEHCCPV